MRIAFDASTLAFAQKTGTGVYCQELINALETEFKSDTYFHDYRLSRRVRGRAHLLHLPPGGHRHTLQDPFTFWRGFQYDIFHGLNTRLPLLAHCKTVATIHDLFSLYGEFSRKEFREDQKRKILQMIARADHLIVPADFTKKQLVQNLQVAQDKITVVPHGVRKTYLATQDKLESQRRLQKRLGFVNPFLLFVGALEKRKNVLGLIAAFKEIKPRFKDLKLVLVGHQAFEYEAILKAINESGYKDDILQVGYVEEVELADFFAACAAFVFLSLEEGFGLPVIEAMACGAPVVVSNTTSLPEVGGGFTFQVAPLDLEATALTLIRVLNDAPEVKTQVHSGLKFAQTQTWRLAAERTRAVYQKVVD